MLALKKGREKYILKDKKMTKNQYSQGLKEF